MNLALDHILMGAPDLEEACQEFQAVAGVAPEGGGSHPGFGTRNQLLSLGDALFFEIIAPDPAQKEAGHRADSLKFLSRPGMLTFCLQSSDLGAVAERARAQGLTPLAPVAMSRTRSEGVRLEWEILYLGTDEWGDSIPFVIDWKGSQHPGRTTPKGCRFLDLTALHPRAKALAAIYSKLGIPVPVRAGMAPGFLLRLDTPNGEVLLT